jgi:hypothetical protein
LRSPIYTHTRMFPYIFTVVPIPYKKTALDSQAEINFSDMWKNKPFTNFRKI